MAKGTHEYGRIKVAIGFDPVMFEALNAEAKRLDLTFAGVVRYLVELGQTWQSVQPARVESTRPVLHLAAVPDSAPLPVVGDSAPKYGS